MRNIDNAMTDVVDSIQYYEPLDYRVYYGSSKIVRLYNSDITKRLKIEIVETDSDPVALVLYRRGFTRQEMERIMDTLMEKLLPGDGNV